MTERERRLSEENERLSQKLHGAMWVIRHIAEHSRDASSLKMARQVIEAHYPGTYPEASAVNIGDVASPADESREEVPV